MIHFFCRFRPTLQSAEKNVTTLVLAKEGYIEALVRVPVYQGWDQIATVGVNITTLITNLTPY